MADKKVLIVAQTPPPFHGQAIMQKHLADVHWNWCRKALVRMSFSESINEVGVFKFRKITELFDLVKRIGRQSRSRVEMVYYPPAGPNRIPIYRDILLLTFLRFRARKIILHFHAGGIDQIFDKVTRIEALIIKRAYRGADAAIVLTDWLKREVEWCRPKNLYVVGNGIEDVFPEYANLQRNNQTVKFLFAGILRKEKGLFTLLRAACILKNQGESFSLGLVGAFYNQEDEIQAKEFLEANDLYPFVNLLGYRNGDEKWKSFQEADVFCMPTIATEAMPISIIEAMMFRMPVISTRWRSIPDLISEGDTGLLFEPDNAEQLAACMSQLIHNPAEREAMGIAGRNEFLQKYTLEQHLKEMEKVFLATLESK